MFTVQSFLGSSFDFPEAAENVTCYHLPLLPVVTIMTGSILLNANTLQNDLKTVEALIFKWKKATQLALEELLQFAPKEPATTMDHLLAHLGIDAETVGFNPSDQTFLR